MARTERRQGTGPSAPSHRGAGVEASPIVLFDGVCHLCQGSVRFIIRRDPAGRFRFAALQSARGQQLAAAYGLAWSALDTMILIADGRAYRKSTAALRIARQLSGTWPLLFVLIAVPRVLRDAVYDFVGRRRYRWFGRSATCWLPADSLEERFLS